jgi:signal transduction histidine kinase/ActR/RegA family two-component response regulator
VSSPPLDDSPASPGAARARRAAALLGALAAATGAVVLAGWALRAPAWTTFGGAISMKANAAICFVLTGAAVALATRRTAGAVRVSRRLAWAGALVGGLTLSEHLVGWDLGLDQLLFREEPGAAATVSPGRMGPPASAAFLLLGVAAALIDRAGARLRLAGQGLALAGAFIALLPIVGYAYGVRALFGVAHYTGIALPTAVALEGLAIAVLLAAPESGLVAALASRAEGGRVARRAVVYSILIPFAAGWLVVRGLTAGTYDGPFAVAFLVLAVVFTLALLAGRDALRLDRVEAARRTASEARDRTERELRQREEALRESDRRKTEFLAMLSHELRNPLAPIRNALQLLDAAGGSPAAAGRARAVLDRQTAHLVKLVDDILDVTRISKGRVELHRARLDLREVVRRTCDDHAVLLQQGGVELRCDPGTEPLWIDADETRVAQVMGNLLQNAGRFTPPGGAVHVVARASEGTAEVRVRDTGAGLEPGQLEHLFEPFAQAPQGLARTQGGLGLGLAIVKGLVELHGGRVAARSAGHGAGSEFTVALPLAGPPAREEGDTAAAAPAAGRLVLVVEDNADAAETLADVLALEGHHVRIAADGRSGIALARELSPDVVLCDIGLPDLSGYEVARALRAEGTLREVTLVAVSGYAQPEDRARALEAGFDAHLPKPPPLERLQALLAAAPRRTGRAAPWS